MPSRLPPLAIIQAQIKGTEIYQNITASWGHLVNAQHGGPALAANLTPGLEAARPNLRLVELELTQFRPNLIRWNALQNYKPEFVKNVDFWGKHLINESVAAVARCGKPGQPSAAEVLDMIRETLNFVRDIYHFETYVPLPPYRAGRR